MTIPEAIIEVMNAEGRGLTCREITDLILERDLYRFKSANPYNMVNHAIRRRCMDYDFPSANPIKLFKVIAGNRGSASYQVIQFSQGNYPLDSESGKKHDSLSTSEMLPIERMQNYHKKHLADIQGQLLELIMKNDPAFFESLVVQLLLRLGYGYGNEAGKVVGKSHDHGIDGIISEDKLGLDKIYIQAKRYNKANKVTGTEVKAFFASMMKAKKGVFITTSSFTSDAVQFVEDQNEKSISLINGTMLCELMVKYGVGVKPVDTFTVFEIDPLFFDI